MTVAEVIEKLLEFPQDMVACRGGFLDPTEDGAEQIRIKVGEHVLRDGTRVDGEFLQIG